METQLETRNKISCTAENKKNEGGAWGGVLRNLGAEGGAAN